MKKEQYLNNEKRLLDYITEYKDEYNCLIVTDIQIARDLNVSKATVGRYRSRLVKHGLIAYNAQHVAGKKQGVFELL